MTDAGQTPRQVTVRLYREDGDWVPRIDALPNLISWAPTEEGCRLIATALVREHVDPDAEIVFKMGDEVRTDAEIEARTAALLAELERQIGNPLEGGGREHSAE